MNQLQETLDSMKNQTHSGNTSFGDWQFAIPKAKYKSMKCQYFGCDKQANYPFKCCSANHGQTARMYKEQLDGLFTAKNGDDQRAVWTVEQVEYYAQLA